ncbi:MAG: hypothetical protein WBG02_04425, partial [Candidatus Acidiferrum sp.]
AVLGLNVVDRFSRFYIRVMPEEHILKIHFLLGELAEKPASVRRRYFFAPFDRLPCEWIL